MGGSAAKGSAAKKALVGGECHPSGFGTMGPARELAAKNALVGRSGHHSLGMAGGAAKKVLVGGECHHSSTNKVAAAPVGVEGFLTDAARTFDRWLMNVRLSG